VRNLVLVFYHAVTFGALSFETQQHITQKAHQEMR